MATRTVARRMTYRVFPTPSIPSRTFANAAACLPDDPQDQREKQAPAVAEQKNRSTWPRSFLPGLFSPFSRSTSLTHMLDTVDRLFDSSFLPPSMSDASCIFSSIGRRTPWDVMEEDKCFKLRVDMPGMSKEQVKLAVEDGDLVVKAEHSEEDKEDDWSSRSYGSYNVRIKLPENVDFADIKAEMKDGVLKVKASKVEGKERHEVKIE